MRFKTICWSFDSGLLFGPPCRLSVCVHVRAIFNTISTNTNKSHDDSIRYNQHTTVFRRRRTVPPAMPIVLYLASCFSPRDLYYNFISSYHRKWRHVEPLGRRTYPGNRQTSRNNHWGTQVKRGCFDAEYRRRHCNRFLAVCCIQNPVPAAWCL